jgi:hypothetical protein
MTEPGEDFGLYVAQRTQGRGEVLRCGDQGQNEVERWVEGTNTVQVTMLYTWLFIPWL